jgi:hypothetical protein
VASVRHMMQSRTKLNDLVAAQSRRNDQGGVYVKAHNVRRPRGLPDRRAGDLMVQGRAFVYHAEGR